MLSDAIFIENQLYLKFSNQSRIIIVHFESRFQDLCNQTINDIPEKSVCKKMDFVIKSWFDNIILVNYKNKGVKQ